MLGIQAQKNDLLSKHKQNHFRAHYSMNRFGQHLNYVIVEVVSQEKSKEGHILLMKVEIAPEEGML